MTIKNIIGFSLFVVILQSCCTEEPYENINQGDIVASTNIGIDLLDCLQNEEILIRNIDDYLRIIDRASELGCDVVNDSILDDFDFSRFSILGNAVATRGCNPYFIRDVAFFKNEKKVVYKISTGTCGFCDGYTIGNENIIIVPSIPNDYIVEFVESVH